MDQQNTNLPQQPPNTISTPTPISSPVDHKQSFMDMWDAFEHILMFISLYILATSIGMFFHYYVDKFFSPLDIDYGGSYSILSWLFLFSGSQGTLPMLMSALVVSFPLFAFFFLSTKKRSIANPELLNLKSRKVLIYITLIGTFLFMVYKIITLIYGSFTGNASINFLLHFLVTVLINGFIFTYYWLEVRKDMHNA